MTTSITFYSYKGGVGRTLALANVASQLAQLGRKVVAVDLDLEAPGLHYKLRPTEPVGGGIVDLIAEFQSTNRLGDIGHLLRSVEHPPHEHASIPEGAITILPAGRVDTSSYWENFSAINWRDFFFGSSLSAGSGLGIPFFGELKERLSEATNADVILFDSLTGITELGGVATSMLADVLVCMFVLNDESLEGARRVMKAVRSASTQPTRIYPVLARLPTPEDHPARRQVNELQLKRFEEQIVSVVTQRFIDQGLTGVEPLMVLHSDPSLQLVERLHFSAGLQQANGISREIGRVLQESGAGSTADGPHNLYFDYVRLFSQLIPASVIDEYLDVMIKARRDALFDDPDGAVDALRDLTRRFPLARAFRALLQVYRVQKNFTEEVLALARDLVKVTSDPREELVWDVVKHCLVYLEDSVNVDDSEFDQGLLEFSNVIWSSHSPRDVGSGLTLANLFAEAESDRSAVEVLENVAHEVRQHGASKRTVFDIVTRLTMVGNGVLAIEIIKAHPTGDAAVDLRLLMRAVLSTRETSLARDLISQVDFNDRAQRVSLKDWFSVMRLAGRADEAQEYADAQLTQLVEVVRRGDELSGRSLQRLALLRELYEQMGRQDELRGRLAEATAKSPVAQRRVARAMEVKVQEIEDEPVEFRSGSTSVWAHFR